MQNVSNGYKTVIRSHDRPYDEVYGTITFTNTNTLSVNPSNLPTNSISIERKCIDGEEIEFGGVFLDTLEMSILNNNYSRYTFFGATVDLNYRIKLENNTWEVIKLGKFTIAEADRPDKNTISFTAYDDMRKLDMPLQADVVYGTPWEVLSLISELTGYPLGFDETYLTNFVNYTRELYFDSSSGLATYRDMVKSVCQMLGCFAHDDRTGHMILTKFHTASDITLNTGAWYSIKIADYECVYVGLSVTSIRGTYVAASEVEDEVGNVLEIPDAPAWDMGLDDKLQSMTNALFSCLRSISYTPCEISMPSDASFDCGDRITLETSNGDTVETLITGYVWRWHGGMNITSKGVNPYLQGVSTSEIASKRLLNKNNESTLFTYYTFINARTAELTQQPTQLVKLNYRANEATTVEIWHEIKMLNEFVTETQSIRLIYYRDGVEMEYSPVETYSENDEHTWGTQMWLQNVSEGTVHTWEVWAVVDSGKATIYTGDLHVLLKGQKLEIQEKADNNITVVDTTTPYEFKVYVTNIIDTLQGLQDLQVTAINSSDTLTPYVFGINVVGINDTITDIAQDRVISTRVTEDGRIRVTEHIDGYRTRITESGEI